MQLFRKSGVVLLMVIYTAAYTPVCEVLKLPVLITHYLEHRQEEPSLSLWAFLDIHYNHGSPKDTDYERDMQLPFKNCENVATPLLAVHHPANEKETPNIHFVIINDPKIQANTRFVHSHYLSDIWQPPRS